MQRNRNIIKHPTLTKKITRSIDRNRINNQVKSQSRNQIQDQIQNQNQNQDQDQCSIRYMNNLDFCLNGGTSETYTDTSVSSENLTKNPTKNPDKIRCYISLTTVPGRFYEDEFIEVLKSLTYQTVKADRIFLSLCQNYPLNLIKLKPSNSGDRLTRMKQIKSMFNNIQIIEPRDYGPATKILGLLEHNEKENFLSDNDLIIVVDDDMIYSKDLVESHLNCYQLYNCDVVAVDQYTMIRSWNPYTFNSSEMFYLGDYKGFLYGWLSFAITFKALVPPNNSDNNRQNIQQFYQDTIKQFPDIYYHDDLLFSLFTYISKLYLVENRYITLFHDPTTHKDLYKIDPETIENFRKKRSRTLVNIDAKTRLDTINPLRERTLQTSQSRYDLENKVYARYNISASYYGFNKSNTEFRITRTVPKRKLHLIDKLELVSSPEDIHISFVRLTRRSVGDMMVITFTVFNDGLYEPSSSSSREIVFKVNDKTYTIEFKIETSRSEIVTKFSHIIQFSKKVLIGKKHDNSKNYSIIQTSSSLSMTKNRFYSISSVLTMSPEFAYKYFDDNDVFKFIQNNYSDMVLRAIQNLIPGAYISDIFRYCYLYLNGGVYMDCKKLLYVPLSEFIDRFNKNQTSTLQGLTDIFVKDCAHSKAYDYAYNSIIVCDKLSKTLRGAIIYGVFNIIKNYYGNDTLSITGPGCLGGSVDYVYKNKYPFFYRNVIPVQGHNWLSYIVDKNDQKVIKNTYYGYYEENKYITTNHYHNLWYEKRIYKKDLTQDYPSVRTMSDVILFKK
jgi:hypothetical protein